MEKNIIVKTALKTIKVEKEALEALERTIGEDFENCVEHIYQSKGRLIVSGIGKSAIVAKKITATLNSTGTPAIYMHAADAIHGDLGMIMPDDNVLCISKSGQTPEIKALVPLVKNLGNNLIGMTANPQSFLAQQANHHLYTPVEKEAEPNNLAPTASSTVQMVMGDALATALLALKGFSPKDFARFHPGGSLGKQLYLRVSDLYVNNKKPQVLINANLDEIILEMTSKRLGSTAVIDHKDQLHGIITDGDLRRMLKKDIERNDIRANNIMSANPKTVSPDTMAIQAFAMMKEYSITQLIVVQDQKYMGIIHLHDLIREGIV